MTDKPTYEMTEENVAAWIGLFQAIGFVVVHWGLIERQIDNWVGHLFHGFGGKELRPRRDIPISLKQKLAFLSACLNKIAELTHLREQGKEIVSRIRTTATHRNDLIHASIASLNPYDGIFRFEKIDYMPERQLLREFTLSHPDFREFLPILTDLVTDTVAFSQKVADIPPRSKR